jgi:subtilisin family serine protease
MRKIAKYVVLALAAVSVSIYAQSGFNPFSGASKNDAKDDDSAYSKSQASRDLTDEHKNKADADHLDRMMSNGGANGVIVQFSSVDDDDADLDIKKARHRAVKQGVKAQFAGADYQEVRDYDSLPMAHVQVNSRRALVKLLSHKNVVGIYENTTGNHSGTENLTLIGQPAAATAGYTGAGTTVVVLDTGVNYTNPAFGGCTAPGVPAATCKVVAAFDVAPSDNSMDDTGHGTNVAGIVAAVAPGANLAVLDVFTPGTGAYATDIIAGINWAIANQALYNIKSINMSINWTKKYTSSCTLSWATAPFASARAAGILPVVSAGNLGWTDGVAEPACAPGAVSVGAVYSANWGSRTYAATTMMKGCTDAATSADKIACFSDSASLMTMFAPGAVITAAGSSYVGTSQAAPHVAAAIAVLRAPGAAPADTAAQTVTRLTSTGTSIKDSRNGLTKPRLNLTAAVNSINSPTNTTKTALRTAK